MFGVVVVVLFCVLKQWNGHRDRQRACQCHWIFNTYIFTGLCARQFTLFAKTFQCISKCKPLKLLQCDIELTILYCGHLYSFLFSARPVTLGYVCGSMRNCSTIRSFCTDEPIIKKLKTTIDWVTYHICEVINFIRFKACECLATLLAAETIDQTRGHQFKWERAVRVMEKQKRLIHVVFSRKLKYVKWIEIQLKLYNMVSIDVTWSRGWQKKQWIFFTFVNTVEWSEVYRKVIGDAKKPGITNLIGLHVFCSHTPSNNS